ncbi:MAG: family oxidoreductase [Solirubrobacteraceae bacterium]|nr:family oxidoreductase [Solirubrobacteraceae bacterium]
MAKLCAIAGGGSQVAKDLIALLEADGWEVSAVDVADYDLLEPQDAERWAASLDRVDALVHLVGGWRGGNLIDETPDEDVALLDDLLIATVRNTTRAFAAKLREAGGRFVLVSSKQAQAPDAKNAAYAASKAYAESWTLALAKDLGEHGGAANIVVVNAIGDDKPSFTPAAHLAAGIAYLLSEEGSRSNGQRLSLHG